MRKEGILVDVRDGLSEEVPFEIRPELYKKKKKSQSFKELNIKREQMQKLRAEISFEIFEEQKAHYGSNLMNKRLNERR